MKTNNSPDRSDNNSYFDWIIVVALLGIAIGFLIPDIPTVQEAQRREQVLLESKTDNSISHTVDENVVKRIRVQRKAMFGKLD